MKKQLFIFLVLMCPLFVFSQNVEVLGGIIADSIDVQSGLIKNVADPISAQDAATKAYVDLLESRLALLTNAPVAEDDCFTTHDSISSYNADVLDSGTPDSDPDEAFRYGNFIEITNVGSNPGSSDNISKKGRALSINNNGTAEDKTDDFVTYTPETFELDTFYYVITDLDGLKDSALVEIDIRLTVQELLDAGQTPIDIYTYNNKLLDSLYGKTYQGGLIFYLNTTTGEGLVATPVDQSNATQWGCQDVSIGGTSDSIGAGQANTTLIVNGCAESGIAARLCDDLVYDGYDDWFLPSKNELNDMYIKLELNGFGGFSSDFYWSSTEIDLSNAWLQNFFSGSQNNASKTNSVSVRAVRAF